MARLPVIPFAAAFAGLALGWWAGTTRSQRATIAAPATAWRHCPMHAWVKSDGPGVCTVCEMDLVPMNAPGNAAVTAVVLSPESIRATGIRTAAVEPAPLARSLRFTGRFEEDMTTHAVISAPVEGRIDGLGLVHSNGKVVQRQPLATIFSRTLLTAAKEYKDALGRDEAGVTSARQKLERYGLVWEQIKTIPLRQEDDPYFGILSPRTGTVVKSYVVEGQAVRDGDKLFEIADIAKLWFIFPAFAQDLPWLEVGQIVEIVPGSAPDLKVKARINSIGRQFDEMTHTVPVRVELENPTGRLGLNSDGVATVNFTAPAVLAVPRAAVLWPGAGPRVYVEKSAGTYELRPLQLGRSGDAAWEVLGGVSEGEKVVWDAAMLIDSQAQLNAAAK